MERVLMFVRLSLCVLLLFSFSPVTHGARMLSARVQAELPPCGDVPGGIPGWDCFDPPTHDLPPCDYKHQRPGIDCWPKTPPAAEVTPVRGITYSAAGGASTHDDAQVVAAARSGGHHVEGQLPPCKDVPGGIPNWNCYDPPSTPLPPCDYEHQNPGIDCRPPAFKAKAVTDISAASQMIAAAQSGDHHVEGELPPCKDVPGGIQNWDCYDPPSTPLPPCDYEHQNPGIDCSTDSQKPRPPAFKAKAATDKGE
ncbi:hypothetical protein KC19_3G230500 [Ceratodon purpureus]|uniref:Uncharacterized protein n=1 Tax=Ceratodon purpureus TaxID=3225 RepID=A0A8T0INZ3_CERPU|nr:hypothetical protein KC19_3G230500 [Ceratodon purpureus]